MIFPIVALTIRRVVEVSGIRLYAPNEVFFFSTYYTAHILLIGTEHFSDLNTA